MNNNYSAIPSEQTKMQVTLNSEPTNVVRYFIVHVQLLFVAAGLISPGWFYLHWASLS